MPTKRNIVAFLHLDRALPLLPTKAAVSSADLVGAQPLRYPNAASNIRHLAACRACKTGSTIGHGPPPIDEAHAAWRPSIAKKKSCITQFLTVCSLVARHHGLSYANRPIFEIVNDEVKGVRRRKRPRVSPWGYTPAVAAGACRANAETSPDARKTRAGRAKTVEITPTRGAKPAKNLPKPATVKRAWRWKSPLERDVTSANLDRPDGLYLSGTPTPPAIIPHATERSAVEKREPAPPPG